MDTEPIFSIEPAVEEEGGRKIFVLLYRGSPIRSYASSAEAIKAREAFELELQQDAEQEQ